MIAVKKSVWCSLTKWYSLGECLGLVFEASQVNLMLLIYIINVLHKQSAIISCCKAYTNNRLYKKLTFSIVIFNVSLLERVFYFVFSMSSGNTYTSSLYRKINKILHADTAENISCIILPNPTYTWKWLCYNLPTFSVCGFVIKWDKTFD